MHVAIYYSYIVRIVLSGNSFSDDERCVCAGYDNGDVKLFDLRTMTLRWETSLKNGVSSCDYISSC